MVYLYTDIRPSGPGVEQLRWSRPTR